MSAPILSAEEVADLSLLLEATSKSVVRTVCQEAFVHRNGAVPEMTLAAIANALGIEPKQSVKLFFSAQALVRAAVKIGASDSATVSSLFPSDFHDHLKGLLSDIIAKNMSSWQSEVLCQQVSLPRLVDFDWRVDIKTSSDCAVRMAQPTCLVEMKVREGSQQDVVLPPTSTVSMEFSRDTLDTMLDGLGRIRDQLASVAAAK